MTASKEFTRLLEVKRKNDARRAKRKKESKKRKRREFDNDNNEDGDKARNQGDDNDKENQGPGEQQQGDIGGRGFRVGREAAPAARCYQCSRIECVPGS